VIVQYVAELSRFELPYSVHPELVDCGSSQGRSVLETAGVAALRRGFPKRENAGLGRKMPIMGGHYLIIVLRASCQETGLRSLLLLVVFKMEYAIGH
jgi:hypothetical protein